MLALMQPLKIGSLEIKNRIIMAPLTRCRASGRDGRTPNDLMKLYYEQRSTAGLILTEATAITPMGVGYNNTPGIWSSDHITGWKKITEAVHAKGGKIALQLWHVGRISDPFYLDGKSPVAPSEIMPSGYVSLMRPQKSFVKPRALETHEIKDIVLDYKKGAENAQLAGFDAVEIHAANGYLIDQFLQDSTNKRTDEYGGSILNRFRFLSEITDAVIGVWGADKVGVHLAPRCDAHDMGDSNPEELFTYVASELSKKKIAFICTREYQAENSLSQKMKKVFNGAFIVNEKFSIESAEKVIESKQADAVAFGVNFIANPDLVHRIEKQVVLNTPQPQTFYGKGPEGYTDYPFIG